MNPRIDLALVEWLRRRILPRESSTGPTAGLSRDPAGRPSSVSYSAMESGDGVPSRELVDELVAEVLGRDGPSPGNDVMLADLGFDSLAFADLSALLAERAGTDLLDGGMTELRSVGELHAVVEAAAAHPGAAGERFPAGMGRRQRAVRRTLSWLFRWWFDLTVVGAEGVPAAGPAVMCMNHESGLDIPAAVVASPRPITFMAKRELFRRPAAAGAFRRMGAFPVDRDLFDLRAVDVGLEVVRRGGVLGMYPEGTRTPGTLLPFLPGAPWIALKTGAPLVPCAISGTERALAPGRRVPRRVPIRVTFAEPIPVEPIDDPVKRRAEAERLAGELREAIRPLVSY